MNNTENIGYICQSYINYGILNDYIHFLENFKGIKKHYIIDDSMFNNRSGYIEVINELKRFLPDMTYIQDIERYINFQGNTHHWTTSYVWKKFIPCLMNDLNIQFDSSDFIFNRKIEKGLDVSYHSPIKSNTFLFENLEVTCKRTGINNILRCQKKNRSGYHELYAGCHYVSYIKNMQSNFGKKLLLNCDSMSIPIIPIIANYFDEILVLDNRNGKKFINKIMTFNPTHYIGLGLYRNYTEHQPDKEFPLYIQKYSNNKIFYMNIQ